MYLVDLSWVNCAWNFRQSSSLTRICASNSRRKSKCSFSVAWTKKEEYIYQNYFFKKSFCLLNKFFPQSCSHQDLLSRNVLGLAILIFLPRRRYHHNLKSTDGLTVLAWIEIVTILVHYQPSCNTSHTMKVHYETQWPTAARRCHFVLRDVSCMQSWHLSTPSHLQVPPEWPYCQQTKCGRWFSV